MEGRWSSGQPCTHESVQVRAREGPKLICGLLEQEHFGRKYLGLLGMLDEIEIPEQRQEQNHEVRSEIVHLNIVLEIVLPFIFRKFRIRK